MCGILLFPSFPEADGSWALALLLLLPLSPQEMGTKARDERTRFGVGIVPSSCSIYEGDRKSFDDEEGGRPEVTM